MKLSLAFFALVLTFISQNALARGTRIYRGHNEIRPILKHHPELEREYFHFLAHNPGVRMAEAQVNYITVVSESSGEREYTCELETTLILDSGHAFTDTNEVDRSCDHLFK